MAVKTISEALVYLKFEGKLKFEVIMFSFLKKDVNYNKFLFLVFNEINWVETMYGFTHLRKIQSDGLNSTSL